MDGYTEWNDCDDADLDDLITAHHESVAAHKAEADRLWAAGDRREACRHYLAAGECLAQARGVEAERDRRHGNVPAGALLGNGSLHDDEDRGWVAPRSLSDVLFDD